MEDLILQPAALDLLKVEATTTGPTDPELTTVGVAINNIDGNKLRNAEWIQRHLDTTRQ